MKKVYVIGAGRVGSAIAEDLAQDYKVTVIDRDKDALRRLQDKIPVDMRTENVLTARLDVLLANADLVISAVPGYMGYKTLERIIKSGKNVVDISFFYEDPFILDSIAKKNNVTAVMDCGLAPGMGNILLGWHNEEMNVSSYECLVGGLPRIREWPFQYKAVFSPVDVIEEYLRPARFVQHGKMVIREALSDVELVEIVGIGTLESFNTDGLRTLIHTMNIPQMIEKTLRYPGSTEYISVLKKAGFFSDKPVSTGRSSIRPIELTSRLLIDQWQITEGEEDITVMRITICGEKEGREITCVYDLIDHYDRKNQMLSMARTTGFTCTAVARLLLEGRYINSGINPPEYLGRKKENVDYILNYLAKRNVNYRKSLR